MAKTNVEPIHSGSEVFSHAGAWSLTLAHGLLLPRSRVFDFFLFKKQEISCVAPWSSCGLWRIPRVHGLRTVQQFNASTVTRRE